MTLERPSRPPQKFLDWLDANYGWNEANRWKLSHAWGTGWQTDPVFLFWETEIPEGQQFQQLPQTLQGIPGAENLDDYLFNLINQGVLSQEESDAFYEEYADNAQMLVEGTNYLDYLGATPEIKQFITGYTSKNDLADRLNQLKLDDVTFDNLYKTLLGQETETGLAMRGAQGRSVADQQKLQEQLEKGEMAPLKRERAQYYQALNPALQQTWDNPLVRREEMAPLLQNLEQFQGVDIYDPRNAGQVSSFLKNLNTLAAQRGEREEQANKALLAGLGENRLSRQLAEAVMPSAAKAIPGERGVFESFISGTGLGEGTKLRNFITSEAGDIAGNLREERQKWWERMNAPEPETFEEAQSRAQQEANRWKMIAGSASSATYTGRTFWGEGGLAGIAQKAYEDALGAGARLKPEDFGRPEPRVAEEDPFAMALRKRKFQQEYYRQPGTGIVSRLSPSIKFMRS